MEEEGAAQRQQPPGGGGHRSWGNEDSWEEDIEDRRQEEEEEQQEEGAGEEDQEERHTEPGVEDTQVPEKETTSEFSFTYSPIVHGPKWFPTMVREQIIYLYFCVVLRNTI